MSSFTGFDLLPSLQATLAEKGFVTPTEIQARAMPALLEGRSIVGVAETGSGKTLAYALPVLHLLKSLENEGNAVTVGSQPRAAVIVPTRELGEQVSKVFKPFTHSTRLRVRTVLGGTTLEIAKRNINGPFDILVATPGRLVKLLDRRLLNLSDVRFLVFDEADQMLDQGFLPDAGRIVGACPAERQMALFSATVSPAVQTLISKLFSSAKIIRSEGSHRVVASLTTENRIVTNGKRFPILENLLAENVKGGTLIFTNTREQCDKLAHELQKTGHPCVIYRGEMDKVVRRANLKAFRDGKIGLLISTDLASRGLDVDHVGRVINYHLPQQMENYIHRVGRTARAGRPGLVINFVTERDQDLVEQLDGVKASPRRANIIKSR
ncbi:MAG: DEAD/DEAH box helicase [Bdellovibrionia bacterium]